MFEHIISIENRYDIPLFENYYENGKEESSNKKHD